MPAKPAAGAICLPGQEPTPPHRSDDASITREAITQKYGISVGAVRIKLAQVSIHVNASRSEEMGFDSGQILSKESCSDEFRKSFQNHGWDGQIAGLACIAHSDRVVTKLDELKKEEFMAWILTPECLEHERFYVVDGAHRLTVALELKIEYGYFMIFSHTTPNDLRNILATSANVMASASNANTFFEARSQTTPRRRAQKQT